MSEGKGFWINVDNFLIKKNYKTVKFLHEHGLHLFYPVTKVRLISFTKKTKKHFFEIFSGEISIHMNELILSSI